MGKKIKTAILLLAFFFIGIAFLEYFLRGEERDLATETTDFNVTSKTITTEFLKDNEASNRKYLEKAVAVTGTVTAVSTKEISIDNTVVCKLKSLDSKLSEGDPVTIKGRVIGYDDLMGELQLDQCLLLETNEN